jgi:hypothetical protein
VPSRQRFFSEYPIRPSANSTRRDSAAAGRAVCDGKVLDDVVLSATNDRTTTTATAPDEVATIKEARTSLYDKIKRLGIDA